MSNWGMKWTPPSSSPALLLPLLPVDGAMQSYRGEQQQCFSRPGWRAHISGVESKSYGAEVVNMVCTWVPYSASSVSRSASGTRFTPILRQNRSKWAGLLCHIKGLRKKTPWLTIDTNLAVTVGVGHAGGLGLHSCNAEQHKRRTLHHLGLPVGPPLLLTNCLSDARRRSRRPKTRWPVLRISEMAKSAY
jgi:hypothetical protein